MPHPDEEQLLRYSDGELPGRATSQVDSHLKACWQCRTTLEEIEKTVGASVRYRSTVLQRHLPAPPAPWTDIYGCFAEIDKSMNRPSLADRLGRILAWPIHHPKQWAPAMLALLIICGLVYRYRLTPSVQAAELLQKAILASDSRPAKPHLLRIRTGAHTVTRRTGTTQMLASNAVDQETLNSLQTLFHGANYNWDDPLSAKSYSAWRDQLSAKRDRVTEERDSFRIHTDTESGDLLEANLQLRSQDLQPIEGRFEFRNRDWVEITALADDAAPAAIPEASAGVAAPEHRITPSSETTSNAIAPVSRLATIGDELRVLAALHQIGADLGDPVEVSRDAGDIVVSGVGIASDRQQQIQQALSALPNVAVRFSESAPVATPPQRVNTATQSAGDSRQLQARIAEQMGGRTNFDQLAAQVLDMSEPFMSRAYALRRLMDRFPIQVEAQLSSQELETLRRLQREHTAALRQHVGELDQVLKPALQSVSGSVRATSGSISYDVWQPATEELFQSARRVEKLLAVMFGAATADSAPSDSANAGVEQVPAQLLSAVAQLRAKVEAYDRLLAKTER